VESCTLAARPQPCGCDRFMPPIDADDNSRVRAAKNCACQAAKPAAEQAAPNKPKLMAGNQVRA
jgi:hypothetical protein